MISLRNVLRSQDERTVRCRRVLGIFFRSWVLRNFDLSTQGSADAAKQLQNRFLTGRVAGSLDARLGGTYDLRGLPAHTREVVRAAASS
jgi:hypothetical protein